MLSRTADHLYWMARYTERAENMARMLDVTHRMSLMPGGPGPDSSGWSAVLAITGLSAQFAQKCDRPTPDRVMHFLCLDRDNPSSIAACLRLARDNAHAVRGTLTRELWETINATWLDVQAMTPQQLTEGAGAFFDRVKTRSHLTHGVMLGTMLADEALWFARIGAYLERADSTARLLDVKYHVLLPRVEDVGGAADYYQWSALLRCVSAFEIYRRCYRDLITPWRVAELLILRPDMPRSLHYCLNEIHEHLARVANLHSRETERRAGELHALLHYGSMAAIFQEGLHEFLTAFIHRLNDLASRLTDDFLVPRQ
jgi:uncharacterized alpha-E superfamily protein